MKVNNDMMQEIVLGDLQTLYNHVRLLLDDNPELQPDVELIKNGIKLKFNINYALKDKFTEKKKDGLIIINHNIYNLEEYWDELELREDSARKLLYEHLQIPDSIKGRD